MKKKIFTRYYADFETTQVNDDNESRVYLWALCNSDYKYHYGDDLESFMFHIQDYKNAIIYFHNLGGWDFQFIHYYLIKNNIDYEISERNGHIYCVKINFTIENATTRKPEQNTVILYDSLNFLPFTLKEIGESFNEKYFKTSIDYETPYDHKATQEEIDYCVNDVFVLCEGMEKFYELMTEIMTENGWKKSLKKLYNKMTISGIAFECFKESTNYKGCCENKKFDYKFLRPAYYGGFVYSSVKREGQNVTMIDDNSMYPFVYSSCDLPIGDAIRCDNEATLKELYKFYVIKILCKFDIKEGYPAIIPGAKNFRNIGCNYQSNSDGEFVEMIFTNIDFERIKKYYNIEYKVIEGYGFYTSKGFYKDYADALIKIKSNSKGARRLCAKLLLNSPYGKLALNPINEDIKYYINEDNKISKDILGTTIDEEGYNYFPQAVAITAYARKVLFDRCELVGWENVLYTDTDSVKFENPKNLVFDYNDYELGAWKNEGFAKYFKTIAPKKYGYFIENEEKSYIDFTCAGFNKKDLTYQMGLTIGLTEEYLETHIDKKQPSKMYCDEGIAIKMLDLFDYGLTVDCLQKKKVVNGVVLKRTTKEMKQKAL